MTPRINWKIPLFLFLATCLTTTFFRIEPNSETILGYDTLHNLLLSICLSVAGAESAPKYWLKFGQLFWDAILFSMALMFILTCHELGHYIQSRRYRVQSSLPFFLPMPIGPFGTFGAVIAMDDEVPNSRALFDIGISGPLAGLIPTLIFLYYGIQWSHIGPRQPCVFDFSDPLLFQWAVFWIFGHIPPDMTLHWHPVAFAAWVGLLLTALNLMPFGQLDGGHIFYALLGRKSVFFVYCIFIAAIIAVIWFQLWHWSLLLVLIMLIGIEHPPTANDAMRLTFFRRCLGWATLLFVFIGFTPAPLNPHDFDPSDKPIWYCMDWYCVHGWHCVHGIVVQRLPLTFVV